MSLQSGLHNSSSNFAADYHASKEEINQYLTFFLDGEEYGVDILGVQEIRGWEKPTIIPNSPDYVKGVVNLRGTIVPTVDLRIRFSIESKPYGPLTVVIVLTVKDNEGRCKVVGIVVDAVSDVYDIETAKIKKPPEVDQQLGNEYISGLYNVDNKMIILLEINKLLSRATSIADIDKQ